LAVNVGLGIRNSDFVHPFNEPGPHGQATGIVSGRQIHVQRAHCTVPRRTAGLAIDFASISDVVHSAAVRFRP